jgi:hypothetical protein
VALAFEAEGVAVYIVRNKSQHGFDACERRGENG